MKPSENFIGKANISIKCNNICDIVETVSFHTENIYIIYDDTLKLLYELKMGVEDCNYKYTDLIADDNVICIYRYDTKKDLFISINIEYYFLILRINYLHL